MKQKSIYVVASYTDTVPGKLITARAKLKFWNRYEGDTYSHISLSRDNRLRNMVSFARKEMKNPFNSGIVTEDIKRDMFVLNPDKSKIAVMQLGVSEETHQIVSDKIDEYLRIGEHLKFNYLGLVSLLLSGTRGFTLSNQFFCSQWATTVLRESGIDIFPKKRPEDVRPFDFYRELKEYQIYEGLTKDYPEEGIDFIPKVFQYKRR